MCIYVCMCVYVRACVEKESASQELPTLEKEMLRTNIHFITQIHPTYALPPPHT